MSRVLAGEGLLGAAYFVLGFLVIRTMELVGIRMADIMLYEQVKIPLSLSNLRD